MSGFAIHGSEIRYLNVGFKQRVTAYETKFLRFTSQQKPRG